MAFRNSKLMQQQDMNMKTIEEKVRKAKLERKVFVMLGKYEAIRTGLANRGWLEKILMNQLPYVQAGSERLVVASLLSSASFNFVWQPKHRPLKFDEIKRPFLNSIQRDPQFDFTRKDGLKNCADNFRWNCIDCVTELNFHPRTHLLDDKSSKDEFFEDYRRTAFTNFIYFLHSIDDFSKLFSTIGTISTDCIDFAIGKIQLLMKIDDHQDIDMTKVFDVCAKFPKDQKKILTHIQQLIKGTKKFKYENEETIEKWKLNIKICIEEIIDRWPHLRFDGFRNIWIFKPLGFSSGKGIILENDEKKMQEILKSIHLTYIAQKYIERPMLIHDRKFDIRIYLLTFILKQTVYIWLYKDCYIKFATNPFDLDDFDRSIHITNYAVQKHFMNNNDTFPGAKENMWTLKQLIDYFAQIEAPRLWEAKIYPAIKRILLAMVIPSLEITEIEHKCFELNGADFMITFDHEPALLEINSVPALFLSRTFMDMITTKLLDDVLKVVVDHSKNPEAYTGDFELIYSQEIPKVENYIDISIVGRKIERNIKRNSIKQKAPIDTQNKTKSIEVFQSLSNRYIYLKQK